MVQFTQHDVAWKTAEQPEKIKPGYGLKFLTIDHFKVEFWLLSLHLGKSENMYSPKNDFNIYYNYHIKRVQYRNI